MTVIRSNYVFKYGLKKGLSVEETVKEINELENEIQKRVPAVKWYFIEPDIKQ